jgi:hypothetical protein
VRDIWADKALIVVPERVAREFVALLATENEREIRIGAGRVVVYPDGASPKEIESLLKATEST